VIVLAGALLGLLLAVAVVIVARSRRRGAAAPERTPAAPRPRKPVMSGKQAALCGGATAVLIDFAWRAALTGDWTPTASAGSALSVLLIALFDIWFAAGAPTDDPVAVANAAAEIVRLHPGDRDEIARAVRSLAR
jgi:drug/metabolite transporter (DMT)-like permease